MLIEDIEKKMVAWLENITGLTSKVVLAFQDAPKHAGQDFIILVSDQEIKQIGTEEQRLNDDGTITILQQQQATMIVNVFGKNSRDKIKKVRTGLNLPKTQQFFATNTESPDDIFCAIPDGPTKNNTVMVDKQYLGFWDLNILVRFSDEFTPPVDDVGYFDEINITPNDLNPSRDVINYPIITETISHEPPIEIINEIIEININNK